MSGITAEFKTEFKKLIELKQVAPNEHLQQLLAALKEQNLMYEVECINPKSLLTHKEKRGGLLLSPHNVHRNAQRIRSSGADLKQLNNALCMELSPHGKLRDEHILRNQRLVERAGGLLAPVNGSERYLTLGCGHTAAFCKQASVGGMTSEPTLRSAGTNTIDRQMICANPSFNTMINEG